MIAVQSLVTVAPAELASSILGLAVISGIAAAIASFAYRWWAKDRIQAGLAVLISLAIVAAYLNTTTALGEVLVGDTDALAVEAALTNIGTFLLAGLTALAGRRVGDRLSIDFFAATGVSSLDAEVGELVSAVGRVTTVTLPDEIEDADGYDPVPDDVKAALAGRTLMFPRRLTVQALETRLRTRLKDEHDVGYVDVDLEPDGSVSYFAVGRRVAGIGPTLGLGDAAVAVPADPPSDASPGDVVQVWTVADDASFVTTAELRGVHEDVVTLVVDERDAETLAPTGIYRLVTMPAEPQPEREFVSLLRSVEESMVAVTVADDAAVIGDTVGSLPVAVLAVQSVDAPVDIIPSRERELAAGDTLYAVATPAETRKLEAAVAGR